VLHWRRATRKPPANEHGGANRTLVRRTGRDDDVTAADREDDGLITVGGFDACLTGGWLTDECVLGVHAVH